MLALLCMGIVLLVLFILESNEKKRKKILNSPRIKNIRFM